MLVQYDHTQLNLSQKYLNFTIIQGQILNIIHFELSIPLLQLNLFLIKHSIYAYINNLVFLIGTVYFKYLSH